MNKTEKIEYMNAADLVPFKDHPFKSRDGDEKEMLIESIKVQGAIEPLIVRPSFSAGKYEIISGHRRLEACKELKIKNVPVIVRNLTDEQAAIMMVDTNLHREHLLPSERAFAYKMKLEAIRHQGKSDNITSRQLVGNRESADIVSNTDSGRQVQRYICLTCLIPELLQMVDEGRIALTPAVELSYLTKNQQQALYDEIEYTDATPNLSQAQRMRALSRQIRLSPDAIHAVMSEEKANQKEKIKFKVEDLQEYFPKSYTPKDMSETILKLLSDYHSRQRSRGRGAR